MTDHRLDPMPVLEASQCEDRLSRIQYDVEYDASTPLCATCGHLRQMSAVARLPDVEEWLDPTLEIVISRATPVTQVAEHAPWMQWSYKRRPWDFEDV